MKLLIAQAAKSFARVLLICLWAGILVAQDRPVDPGLTAHEWGTFTSIAGSDGQAVEWRPLSLSDLIFEKNAGSSDGRYRSKELPSFVETLNWGIFKSELPATIRMETPVLYFYSSHPVTLSVQVKFTKGLITEWYPHAVATAAKGEVEAAAAYRDRAGDGAIAWTAVAVQPGPAAELPRDSVDNDNRYYAARETASTPLRVPGPRGDQQEKFLFYRGVSQSAVPISATFMAQGSLLVRNSFAQGISYVMWFECRGDRVGYRISPGPSGGGETVLEPLELTATVEAMYGDLEEMLTARGLYREEAHAMVQTWRNSWFEEGSRLFYIVPPAFVDSILPLTITPVPAQTVRVFVGRLELISPATRKAVAAAMATNDNATLQKYGRFLDPILEAIHGKNVPLEKSVRQSGLPPCLIDDGPPATAKR